MGDMLRTLILALTAGTILSGGAWAQPIRIGLSGPFSGAAPSTGYAMRDGVRLAASEINQAGGIMGRPIVLIERDDGSNVQQGERVARELITTEHVVAALGFVDTDVALAAQRFYEGAEIPVLNDVAPGTEIARQFAPPDHKANYIFQMAANDAIQAALIAREAITVRHFKAPAILTDSSAYGQAGLAELTKALDALQVTPAAKETFNVGDTDMTDQLSRVKRAAPDVLLTFGMGPELIGIVNSMATLGWKLPIVGSWPLSTQDFIGDAGFNSDGVSMPQTYVEVGNTARRAAFVATYQRIYKMPRIISADCAAQSYDSVYLLKAAIEQAGSTDGPKIRAALENLRTTVEGVVTTYDRPFSPADHEAISAEIPIFGVIRARHVTAAHEQDIEGGKLVRVKP
jgi:branched-chain amino acid transport system substrate-binding protein